MEEDEARLIRRAWRAATRARVPPHRTAVAVIGAMSLIAAVALVAFGVRAVRAVPIKSAAAAADKEAGISHTTLKVGDEAPDFTLPDTEFKPVTLSSFRGKKDVILAFYVLAFTGG